MAQRVAPALVIERDRADGLHHLRECVGHRTLLRGKGALVSVSGAQIRAAFQGQMLHSDAGAQVCTAEVNSPHPRGGEGAARHSGEQTWGSKPLKSTVLGWRPTAVGRPLGQAINPDYLMSSESTSGGIPCRIMNLR